MADLGFGRHLNALTEGHFLRVVNYHNTPPSQAGALRAELSALAETFDTITLADLDGFFATGRWPTSRPVFVPVFYEGYRNSATVAAPILDDLGLTGVFPICTGFVDCPPAEQEFYARSHWIGLVPEEIGQDRLAMTWDEIGELSVRHLVTPHTASHVGINDVSSDDTDDFWREVVQPKQRMDAVTGQSAPAFAWLHGTSFGVSAPHDEALIAAGYRYLIGNTLIHRIG
ncbi:polysaccharide deacetylase family protein [Jatrophihabitans telluris]|uniref:Polysaccharide deacetylase family protein n=1 Tax=Jatrophihabitans telluris TaxID=2038343 RepID=A0ABY4QXF8_9ACTN|nr:polysaccharide deacetylase family protein [Jatrophihabitans telluris]UQX88225.1 polysaccharide deacetylase family protein [Jatrophihabitans telluris]